MTLLSFYYFHILWLPFVILNCAHWSESRGFEVSDPAGQGHVLTGLTSWRDIATSWCY